GSSLRFSPTLGTQMMYVAVAVSAPSRVDRPSELVETQEGENGERPEGGKVRTGEGRGTPPWLPSEGQAQGPAPTPSDLPTFLPSSSVATFSPSPPLPSGPGTLLVRVASPLTEVDQALRGIYANMLWAGLAIAGGAAVLSLAISRRISRPIVEIERTAERFAAGELNLRVPMPDSAELADLASSLNKMAVQLGDRIMTITEQRNKLDAILASMAEGVFAVDSRGYIVSVNPAAAELLGLSPERLQGRPVEEAVRNAQLQEFVRQMLAGVPPEEADISLLVSRPSSRAQDAGQTTDDNEQATGDEGRTTSNERRFFRLQGAGLTDARGRRSGAVIVLNDMTRIRQLEAVRRDFVANVSHELKTPVTSIQGFVEALVEGGVQDPTQVERYLGIIARHASRLNSIIDDLLTLSRLEEAGEQRALTFAHGPIRPVLEEAIHLSGVRADEKRMTVELTCDEDLQARINPPLLEQAVMNLLDNAIKYSPEGSRIRVRAWRVGPHGSSPVARDLEHESQVTGHHEEVSISVTDEGYGIAPEHLQRIFERFYVVDKSRSRKLGGTGLGLAIVKHIAQAHGGHVTVASTPGQGSTFTLHLPV
ncbi:MAG: PAS domain-containing protein, partial [Planctomycetes bacterium]|nr:PAS domain-containing protein [Planctomycetota bacterium]